MTDLSLYCDMVKSCGLLQYSADLGSVREEKESDGAL